MDGLPRHLEHGCGTCRRKKARQTWRFRLDFAFSTEIFLEFFQGDWNFIVFLDFGLTVGFNPTAMIWCDELSLKIFYFVSRVKTPSQVSGGGFEWYILHLSINIFDGLSSSPRICILLWKHAMASFQFRSK
jgi:hypothetical protein